MDMKDKVVVVTGASSGIGRATAHAFAKRGASLLLAARSDQQLDVVEAECAELGVRAIGVPTDVRQQRRGRGAGRPRPRRSTAASTSG